MQSFALTSLEDESRENRHVVFRLVMRTSLRRVAAWRTSDPQRTVSPTDARARLFRLLVVWRTSGVVTRRGSGGAFVALLVASFPEAEGV